MPATRAGGDEIDPMTMSDGLWGKLAWTEADPDEGPLTSATANLAAEDGRAADLEEWPAALWATLERIGGPRWTLPEEYGGTVCPRPALVQRYARLAGGSLTAVFILSQHDAAIRRLLAAPGNPTAERWLGAVGRGRAIATVGISHLTTSRRLGAQAIRAVEDGPGRFRLDGTMPWVTGATRADLVVTGGALDDGRQVLVALPTDRPGVARLPAVPPGRAPGFLHLGDPAGRRRGRGIRPAGGSVHRRPVALRRRRDGRAGDLGAGAGPGPRRAVGARRTVARPRASWPSRSRPFATTGGRPGARSSRRRGETPVPPSPARSAPGPMRWSLAPRRRI